MSENRQAEFRKRLLEATQKASGEVNQRLAQARQKAGYQTASDAARAFGWNENTYRSHENGERGLKVDIAYKYARAFRVRFEWLMIGEHSDFMFTTESHILSDYVDDAGMVHKYPKNDTGKFRRLVAISSYISKIPPRLAEMRTTRPIIGCWPGDLLVLLEYSAVINKTNLFPGDVAIIELPNGTEILRLLRFNNERSMVDTQLYNEMGPSFSEYKRVYIVQSVIKHRGWVCETMEGWRAQLIDPTRKFPEEEPAREP